MNKKDAVLHHFGEVGRGDSSSFPSPFSAMDRTVRNTYEGLVPVCQHTPTWTGHWAKH